MNHKQEMVDAICSEIRERSGFFEGEKVETLYLGGGTPSVLAPEEIERIISEAEAIFHFQREDLFEITFEANPDDMEPAYLNEIKQHGINRLSIGIQSMDDNILRFLNRSHTSKQASNALQESLKAGISKINLDFIYGIPGRERHQLMKELEILREYDISHLSMYALTIEERTAFGNWHKKGKLKVMDEEQVIEEYKEMKAMLAEMAFEQYEISNFARDGLYARHNSNYWKGKKYLGIGPSAHSFNGDQRSINPSNNPRYLKETKNGNLIRETELLSPKDKFNEYVMTSLRTKWGLDKFYLQTHFPAFMDEQNSKINKYISEHLIAELEDRYILSEEGKLLADEIAADLFVL
jgi:oxygen-independent coproporphyrinogen-3 oxidase